MQDTGIAADKSRKGKGKASLAKSSLQFVNARTGSETEKRDVRKLVRANATYFRWRQARKANVRSETVRASLQQSQSADSDEVNIDDEQARHGALPVSRRISAILPRIIQPQGVTISHPLNLVGIGHIDAFEVYPSELPNQVVGPILAKGR
jgi:hypothetical protein